VAESAWVAVPPEGRQNWENYLVRELAHSTSDRAMSEMAGELTAYGGAPLPARPRCRARHEFSKLGRVADS